MDGSWADALARAPSLKILQLTTWHTFPEWFARGYMLTIGGNPHLEEIRCYGTRWKDGYVDRPAAKAGLPPHILNLFTSIKIEREWGP